MVVGSEERHASSSKSKARDSGNMKTQSSIEYLSVFTVALVIIIIVIAIVAMLFVNQNTSTSTYTSSSCYISPQIDCQQLVVATNGVKTTAIIAFTNNLGQTMHFTANSFVVYPSYSQSSYYGMCYPANALQGAFVICNATLTGYNPSAGTQLNPRFQLTYLQCQGEVCTTATPTTYNSAGTGTVYVSAGTSTLAGVQLESVPSGGQITLDGIEYPTNTLVQFVKGASYTVYADPPAGYNFDEWITQAGVTVQNPANQGTTATATSNGILIASFQLAPVTCYALTTAVSPSGAGTTTLSIANSIGCPAGSNTFTAGQQIRLTAAPIGSNSFTSWTSSSSSVQFSTSNPYTITMPSSPLTMTANFGVSCYQLTFSSNPTGGGSITANPAKSPQCTANGYYTSGQMVTLTETPASSYFVFSGWGGAVTDSNPADTSVTITINGATTEVAYYTQVFNYVYCMGSDDSTDGVPPQNPYAQIQYAKILGSQLGATPVTSAGVSTWTFGTNPYPVSDFQYPLYAGCSIYNGYIYCVGGNEVSGADNLVYSAPITPNSGNPTAAPSVGSWSPQLSYPVPMVSAGCSTYNGYIYCVGSGESPNTQVYYASVSSGTVGTWMSTNSYPIPFQGGGCSIYEGYMYCMGSGDGPINWGASTPSPYDANEVYSAPILGNGGGIGAWSNTLTTEYPLAPYWGNGNYQDGCSIYNGYIYCIGWEDGVSEYYAPVSNGAVGAWTYTGQVEAGCPSCWFGGEGAAIYNGYIYTFGSSGTQVWYAPVGASVQPTEGWPYYGPADGIGGWTETNSLLTTDSFAYCEIPGGSGGYLGGGGVV